MRLGRRAAIAASAIAATTIPVATVAPPAAAGPGDDKDAAVEWGFTFTPAGTTTPVTCSYRGIGLLREFEGLGIIMVLGNSPPCFVNSLQVRISYTDRSGAPAVVRGGSVNGRSDVFVEADDVLRDMTVEVSASYECTPAGTRCTTSRTVVPK